MPTHCIAAGCSTVSGNCYSLHEFPCDESLCAKWTRTIKLQQASWKGPTPCSVLCSKHFKADCFITGECGNVTLLEKRLKPNAISTIFPKPDVGCSKPTAPLQRLALERRK